jgi:hypothetical protein
LDIVRGKAILVRALDGLGHNTLSIIVTQQYVCHEAAAVTEAVERAHEAILSHTPSDAVCVCSNMGKGWLPLEYSPRGGVRFISSDSSFWNPAVEAPKLEGAEALCVQFSAFGRDKDNTHAALFSRHCSFSEAVLAKAADVRALDCRGCDQQQVQKLKSDLQALMKEESLAVWSLLQGSCGAPRWPIKYGFGTSAGGQRSSSPPMSRLSSARAADHSDN